MGLPQKTEEQLVSTKATIRGVYLDSKQAYIIPKIVAIEINQILPTFYGGRQTLVKWYITKINSI